MKKFLLILGALFLLPMSSLKATTSVDATITSSPEMHDIVKEKITLNTLEQEKYDIHNFFINVTLPNDDKTVKRIMENLLGNNKQLGGILGQCKKHVDELVKVDSFKDFVLFYQKAEAEGVFYRDLNRIMEKDHENLKGKPGYLETMRKNHSFVDRWFSILDLNAFPYTHQKRFKIEKKKVTFETLNNICQEVSPKETKTIKGIFEENAGAFKKLQEELEKQINDLRPQKK